MRTTIRTTLALLFIVGIFLIARSMKRRNSLLRACLRAFDPPNSAGLLTPLPHFTR
jgi:hypothetical protein